jgi:hypothetical protein
MPRALPLAYKKSIFLKKRKFELVKFVCRRFCRRCSVLRRGLGYADGNIIYAERPKRRRHRPRAAVGVAYTEGQAWLRRGQLAIGVCVHSCSDFCYLVLEPVYSYDKKHIKYIHSNPMKFI